MNGVNDDPSHGSLIKPSNLPENLAKKVDQSGVLHYPLSHGQRALWFVQQLSPGSVAHNIVYAVRVLSEVDYPALQRTLDRLVDRHPILRTTYTMLDGEPTACEYRQGTVVLQRADIANWTQSQLDEALKAQMFQPFNLETGPLMRVMAYSRAPDHHIWLLSMHHIITDMWSVAVFLMELGEIYAEETTGQPSRLRPVSATFCDYVLEQNTTLSGPEGQRMAIYWAEKLALDLPPLDLVTDFPRPAVQTDHGDAVVLQLDPELVYGLKTTAGKLNTNLHNLVLAAYQVLLSKYGGQNQLRIGYPKFGRGRSMARVLGYFINPIVLTCDLSDDPSFCDFLRRVEAEFKETADFDAYPFRLVVENTQPERDLSRSPIFQYMFAWQKTTSIAGQTSVSSIALGEEEHAQVLNLGLLKILPYNMPARVVPFDLTLLMAETEGDLCATVEYKTDLFKKETITRFLNHFKRLVQSIVAEPDQRVSQLSILPETEAKQILQWNIHTHTKGLPATVISKFEEWVRLTPDAIALETDQGQLSYSELNAAANRLAHALLRRGVRPRELVGVCLPRSADLITALVAVMKTGAGYLPFDANYPAERIQFMARDAGIALMVTHTSLLYLSDDLGIPVISLDNESITIAAESAVNLKHPVQPGDPAYVIYTSGSTGTPKGVIVAHGPFASHCRNVAGYFLHGKKCPTG